jgi:hypothetical protein
MDRALAEARRELTSKPRSQIEEETAFKWAARAVAAYQLYTETDHYQWLRDAGHYMDEAIEHAALADQSGEVLRSVRKFLHQDVPRDAL